MRVEEKLAKNSKKKKKTKIKASSPTTSRETKGERMEVVTDFFLWGSKITAEGDCSHEI